MNPDFATDISHWYGTSQQTPTCVFNAGSPEDVSVAMKIISSNRTPFAVMGGGHTSNPGFSSTTGVHMVLKNMQEIFLSPDRTTVELGFGLTWGDVYTKLDQYGVSVNGGRVAGPGVPGFSLGGGYSCKSTRRGVLVDLQRVLIRAQGGRTSTG